MRLGAPAPQHESYLTETASCNSGTYVASVQVVDDEDTEVGTAPAEFEDTDREILVGTTQMFEDTGIVIIDKPAEPPGQSDRFVVTFRKPTTAITFREQRPRKVRHVRASTADGWPPPPRAPAARAPKRTAIYTIVPRPGTEKN